MKTIYLIIIFLFINSFLNNAFASRFDIRSLTKLQQETLTKAGVWQAGCPVKLADLRLITISYYDLLGDIHHDGQLLINKKAAENTLAVFKKLYKIKFPFSSIETLIRYKGNISLAEEKNVTYGLVCQRDDKNQFVKSSWGTVLTINPSLNPQLKYLDDKTNEGVIISPRTGLFSINRNLKLKGMTETIYSYLNKNHFFPFHLRQNEIGWKQFIFDKNNPQGNSNVPKTSLTVNKVSSVVPVFTYGPLSYDIMNNLKKSGNWFAGCPVPLNRLNLLTLSYYGFDKQVHTGTLIMFDAIAPYAASAFKAFYQQHLPIEKFDVFHSSDDNENTSAFNCRNMVGKNNFSMHAYGLAVDINVSRNPYIGTYKKDDHGQMIGSIIPSFSSSLTYLNRSEKRVGMNEPIVNLLAKHGFTEWGGHWQDTTDYMHFQVPMGIAKHLIALDKPSALQVISLVIKYPEAAKHMSTDTRWNYLYKLYSGQYIKVLKKYFPLLKTKEEAQVIQLIYKALVNNK